MSTLSPAPPPWAPGWTAHIRISSPRLKHAMGTITDLGLFAGIAQVGRALVALALHSARFRAAGLLLLLVLGLRIGGLPRRALRELRVVFLCALCVRGRVRVLFERRSGRASLSGDHGIRTDACFTDASTSLAEAVVPSSSVTAPSSAGAESCVMGARTCQRARSLGRPGPGAGLTDFSAGCSSFDASASCRASTASALALCTQVKGEREHVPQRGRGPPP